LGGLHGRCLTLWFCFNFYQIFKHERYGIINGRDLVSSPKYFLESTWTIFFLFPSSTSSGFLQGIFKDCFGILSINRKILLENKSYYGEGVALQMNQSFAFEFLCENFQPKLINSYSNFKRVFFIFYCETWVVLLFGSNWQIKNF
jgi:hypothetical protein